MARTRTASTRSQINPIPHMPTPIPEPFIILSLPSLESSRPMKQPPPSFDIEHRAQRGRSCSVPNDAYRCPNCSCYRVIAESSSNRAPSSAANLVGAAKSIVRHRVGKIPGAPYGESGRRFSNIRFGDAPVARGRSATFLRRLPAKLSRRRARTSYRPSAGFPQDEVRRRQGAPPSVISRLQPADADSASVMGGQFPAPESIAAP